MSADRRAIHAYVSADTHEAWHRFCEEEGISLSGLLEVMGPRLGELLTQDEVKAARRIDAERRRRGVARNA